MQQYIGASREEFFHTTDKHSAHHYGNIGVHVVATVSIIAFVEQCSGLLLASIIPNNKVSVGTLVHIKHRLPASIGTVIRVCCTIIEYNDNKIRFSVKAYDGERVLLEGSHGRAILSRNIF